MIESSGLDEEREYYEILTTISGKKISDHLFELTANLNAKASALLTHVSIMIVAAMTLTISPAIEKHRVINDMLHFEVFLYVFVAGLILLSVDITDVSTFREPNAEHVDRFMLVVRRRRRIYKSSLYITIAATCALAFAVIFDF